MPAIVLNGVLFLFFLRSIGSFPHRQPYSARQLCDKRFSGISFPISSFFFFLQLPPCVFVVMWKSFVFFPRFLLCRLTSLDHPFQRQVSFLALRIPFPPIQKEMATGSSSWNLLMALGVAAWCLLFIGASLLNSHSRSSHSPLTSSKAVRPPSGDGGHFSWRSTEPLSRKPRSKGKQNGHCDLPFGAPIGFAHNVPAFSNCNSSYTSGLDNFVTIPANAPPGSNDSSTVFSGMQWQCVEYGRRFLIEKFNVAFGSVVGASDIWDLPNVINVTNGASNVYPFVKFGNGEKVANRRKLARALPRVGDLLIYPVQANDMPFGHVAVVVHLDRQYLYVGEQNWDSWQWSGYNQNYSRALRYFVNFTGTVFPSPNAQKQDNRISQNNLGHDDAEEVGSATITVVDTDGYTIDGWKRVEL